MMFEDNSSLGSGISEQQSPEPTTGDQSKSSAEDASSVGGEKSTSGVLTGGSKVVDAEGLSNVDVFGGVAKCVGSRKEGVRSFSKSKLGLGGSRMQDSSQEVSKKSRSRPVSYRRPHPSSPTKAGRRSRTTSLLNIFVASSVGNLFCFLLKQIAMD